MADEVNKDATPPETGTFKPQTLKVNGKEVTVNSLDELVTLAQKGAAAGEAWQKASEAREQASEAFRIQDLVRKAVKDQDRSAEVELYRAMGLPKEQIAALEAQMKKVTVEDDKPEADQSVSGGAGLTQEQVQEIMDRRYAQNRARDTVAEAEADLLMEVDSRPEVAKMLTRVSTEGRDTLKQYLQGRATAILRTDLQDRLKSGVPDRRVMREIVNGAFAKAYGELSKIVSGPTQTGRAVGSPGNNQNGAALGPPKPPSGRDINEFSISRYGVDFLMDAPRTEGDSVAEGV